MRPRSPRHVDARRQALRPRHRQRGRGQDHGLRGRGARARGQGQARPRRDVQRQGAPERRCSASRPIGPDVTRVADNVWAVNMRPGEGARGVRHHRASQPRALQDALRQQATCAPSSAPCRACRSGRCSARPGGTRPRRASDGALKYDVVILDAPATGHGLDMLRVPKVIVDVVPPGLLRRDAERAWALFQDPDDVRDRPRDAARRDAHDRDDRAGPRARTSWACPIGRVVVNGVLPPLFSREERAALEAVASVDPAAPGRGRLVAGRDRVDARARAGREPQPALARAARAPGVPAAALRGRRASRGNPSAVQARVTPHAPT